jgi:hypothetical protein
VYISIYAVYYKMYIIIYIYIYHHHHPEVDREYENVHCSGDFCGDSPPSRPPPWHKRRWGPGPLSLGNTRFWAEKRYLKK